MSDETQVIDESPLPMASDIVVVAETREEMADAQRSLVGWIQPKIAQMAQDVAEAQANVDLATTRKWSTVAFKKALVLAQGRLTYYQKIGAALEAGYVIMPDLPGVTIAVRTSQSRPRQTRYESRWSRLQRFRMAVPLAMASTLTRT